MSSVSLVLSVKLGRPVSPAQSGMARTIRAAIWWRSVGSFGQNSGGVADESQPLIPPRAARASMATQAGLEDGTSPKRVPQVGLGLEPAVATLNVRTTLGAAA